MIKVATQARTHAYAPYSEFFVGAALLTKSGNVFGGCNVENVPLGLTICAERAAVAAAAADGHNDFVSITLVTNSDEPAVPCGACRQVPAEFSPALKIVASTIGGRQQEFSLSDLLPRSKQGVLESFRDV